jgi:hypothetical protein
LGGKTLTEKEEEEITVKAPSKQVIAPQKKLEKATEKALEEERYNVLQISKKMGKYIGFSSVCAGAILLILLAYASLTAQSNWLTLSSVLSYAIIGLWMVTGLISVIVGFVLIGSE